MRKVSRGDVFYADLGYGQGSEQSGHRPVLIIQNDIGNKNSPTVIIAPITSTIRDNPLPTHVIFEDTSIFDCKSCVLLEQIRVIDKGRLKMYLGKINNNIMSNVNDAIIKSLDLPINSYNSDTKVNDNTDNGHFDDENEYLNLIVEDFK